MAGLSVSMRGMKKSFTDKALDFSQNQSMNDISFHLDHVRVQSDNLSKSKYENLLQEHQIFQ